MANLRHLFQQIKRSLFKLFSWFKSGRRTSPRQPISQTSRGNGNINVASINATNVNFELQLKQAPPDAKFRLPEPFYREKLEDFTGRIEELTKLTELLIEKQHLEPGKNRAIIYGMPGVGKSALACYFAYYYYYQQNQFPDGVYGLRVDVEGQDTLAIARKFANLCGENINPEDERDATTIMQDLFADRRALLILDNAENTDIRCLFPSTIECAVIITTRINSLPELLKISPDERRIQLYPLAENESLDLLGKIIGKKRIKVEPDYAHEIIRRVGNLPLALQVVGATLNTGIWHKEKRPLEKYADALHEEKIELLRLEEDQYLDVRASFSLSLKCLPSVEQEFFSCLGACARNGFSLMTAAAIGNYSSSKTRIYLDNLVRFSLVNQAEVEQEQQERYNLHTLIYEFAQYKLEENQALKREVKNRHADHFLKFIRDNDLQDGDVLTSLDQDIEDITLAAEWLINQETNNYDFILSLGDFFEQFKYWQQAIDLIREFRLLAEKKRNWASVVELSSLQLKFYLLKKDFQQAKTILDSIPTAINHIKLLHVTQSCEAMRLSSLSSLYQRQNKLAQAEQTLRDSYQILVGLGERNRQAKVLNKLGFVLQRQERFSEAVEILEKSKDIYEEINNLRGLVKVLTNLGIALYKQDRFQEALSFLERSRIIAADKLKDRGRSSIILSNIGLVYQGMQRFDQAETFYLQSYSFAKEVKDFSLQNTSLKHLFSLFQTQGQLERSFNIAQELGEDKTIIIALNQLAQELLQQKKFDEAREASYQGIKIANNCQKRILKIYGYNIVAGIFKKQGKLAKAKYILRRCISLSEELKEQQSLAISLNTLGEILQKQGQLEKAENTFIECIDLRRELENKKRLVISLNTLGEILQEQDQLKKAENIFRECVDLCKELEDEQHLVISLNTLGVNLQKQGKLAEAEYIINDSIDLCKELEDEQHLVISFNTLGEILQDQGKLKKAEYVIKDSIYLCRQLKNDKSLVISLNTLARILQQQGDLAEAEKNFRKCVDLDKKLGNKKSLVISLITLGGVLKQQRKFEKAKEIFRKCVDLDKELGNDKNLVKSLYSLGLVYQQQEEYQQAIDKFKESISIAKNLKDKSNLAKVYTALGNTFIAQENYEQAVEQLKKAFLIDEKLKNEKGLGIIFKSLYWAFKQLDRNDEAIKFYERAIKIAPTEEKLINLKDELYKPPNQIVQGVVKSKKTEYGFIYSKEISDDILFHKNDIKPDIFDKLIYKTQVEVEVSIVSKGYKANKITIIKQPLKSKDINKNKNTKTGRVTELNNKRIGNYHGYISPENIYFHEKGIGTNTFFKLRVGTRVEVEVKKTNRGLIAQKIKIID